MAFLHGKNTTVYLGAVDLSTYLTNIDLGVVAEQADTTTFKATWKSEVLGTLNATVGFSGLYDGGDTTLHDAFATAVPGVLTVCPGGGAAIGDAARLVSAIDVANQISTPVGGVVAITGSFTANASVGLGRVLHPMGEDTNTTTGASRDDLAETATGWTASLHISAIDGGSWVIKIEDSANNTDWAEAISFGGIYYLHSPSPTTVLRRYVRYVATRTGGVAGDGITFLLAYARN